MYKDEIEKAISGYDMDDVLDTYDLDDIADYLSDNDYYVYKEDPTDGMVYEDEVMDKAPEVDVTAIAYNEMHAGKAKAKDFLTDILGLQHTVPTSKILAKVAELIM